MRKKPFVYGWNRLGTKLDHDHAEVTVSLPVSSASIGSSLSQG